MDKQLLNELAELNSLLNDFSKGLCEESQVIESLQRVKSNAHSTYNGKPPNNISTQLIALEKDFFQIKSKTKIPKFQLKSEIPKASTSKSCTINQNDNIKPEKFLITNTEVEIVSKSNNKFLIEANKTSSPSITLENLYDCEIQLLDVVSTIYIKKVNKCTICLGPCSGSIMIHESHNSTFKLSSKQLRIHDSSDLKCMVNTIIPPIIENCTNIGYKLNDSTYPDYEKQLKIAGLDELVNKTKHNIIDFCWQKNTPSPNWYHL